MVWATASCIKAAAGPLFTRVPAVLLVAVVGCGPNINGDDPWTRDYRATVASAKDTIPVAVEMERLFGDADHFITHYGFDKGPKVWNSEVYFGGRYCLTMQVDVTVDHASLSVSPVGEPVFYLVEIVKVEPRSLMAHSGIGKEFGVREWQEFYESGGDLATLGIRKNESQVPNFRKYVNAVRRDRVHVSLIDE